MTDLLTHIIAQKNISVNLLWKGISYLWAWYARRKNLSLITIEKSRDLDNCNIIYKCCSIKVWMIDNFCDCQCFFICISSVQFPFSTNYFLAIWLTRELALKMLSIKFFILTHYFSGNIEQQR